MSPRSRRALLPLILPLSGCLLIPIPHLGHQVGPKELTGVRPGTSRAELVRLLGEPQALRDDRLWVYDWTTHAGTMVFVSGAPGAGGAAPYGARRYRALVTLDSAGYVDRYEIRGGPEGHGDRQRQPRWKLSGCPDAGACTAVAFDSGGRRVVALEGRRSVWRWALPDSDTRTAKGRRTRKVGPAELARLGLVADTLRSPDGSLRAIAGKAGEITLLAAEVPGREITLAPGVRHPAPRGASFSPDGRWLVVVSDAAVEWWNLERLARAAETASLQARERVALLPFGRPAPDRIGRLWCPPAARFSPDGRRLATLAERRVVLWDVATGEPTDTLDERDVAACALAFSPDSRLLATAGNPGARVWLLPDVPAASLGGTGDRVKPEHGATPVH